MRFFLIVMCVFSSWVLADDATDAAADAAKKLELCKIRYETVKKTVEMLSSGAIVGVDSESKEVGKAQLATAKAYADDNDYCEAYQVFFD